MAVQSAANSFRNTCLATLILLLGISAGCGGGNGGGFGTGPVAIPVFVSETHTATDGPSGTQFNSSTLSVNVTGSNTLLIAAWHAEFDGNLPDGWTVQDNGVNGTEIVDTDGYNGGTGNRRFRIYYWLNPTGGSNTVTVFNPYTGGNELAVSVLLFNNVSQTTPVGTPVLDVSPTPRTGESETVPTAAKDLVLHVIADQLIVTGTLGSRETSVSVANDGHHPPTGDASLDISTKPGASGSTTVSSSGWASFVINGVGIAIHGIN
jgi:hypothetical protein